MIRLPHWRITDKLPAFYDTESATAIEQTAKLYGAMQTLIDEYNEFVDAVNKDIDSFENSSDKNYEEFTVAMAQKFQDFIDIVDLKNKHQNATINNSVNALKEEIQQMFIILRDEVFGKDDTIEWHWMSGKIDVVTGEWIDNEDGDSYAHTEFINIPKGYDITSDYNTIISIYEYDSVTKEFIGYLTGVSGETYTTTRDVTICMVVREYSPAIEPNVTITKSNALVEEIKSLSDRIGNNEYKINLHTTSISNLIQRIAKAETAIENLEEMGDYVVTWNWIVGNIDRDTGEWIDNEDGDSYAHTNYIYVPKGYDITSDYNTIISIYEYDSVTKEFIGYLTGVSGETYTTTRDVTICMVVREYSPAIEPNVTITKSNEIPTTSTETWDYGLFSIQPWIDGNYYTKDGYSYCVDFALEPNTTYTISISEDDGNTMYVGSVDRAVSEYGFYQTFTTDDTGIVPIWLIMGRRVEDYTNGTIKACIVEGTSPIYQGKGLDTLGDWGVRSYKKTTYPYNEFLDLYSPIGRYFSFNTGHYNEEPSTDETWCGLTVGKIGDKKATEAGMRLEVPNGGVDFAFLNGLRGGKEVCLDFNMGIWGEATGAKYIFAFNESSINTQYDRFVIEKGAIPMYLTANGIKVKKNNEAVTEENEYDWETINLYEMYHDLESTVEDLQSLSNKVDELHQDYYEQYFDNWEWVDDYQITSISGYMFCRKGSIVVAPDSNEDYVTVMGYDDEVGTTQLKSVRLNVGETYTLEQDMYVRIKSTETDIAYVLQYNAEKAMIDEINNKIDSILRRLETIEEKL